jgi:hypothetical protein
VGIKRALALLFTLPPIRDGFGNRVFLVIVKSPIDTTCDLPWLNVLVSSGESRLFFRIDSAMASSSFPSLFLWG